MAMIIIALLVIAVVVVIVLKKRGDNQGNVASKKGAGKATKKVAPPQTSRTALAQEQQEPTPPTTTPIAENLRQKLEQYIQNGNYPTAEAQINQALKQDNTQHELYLFLLDIHLAQKDDFAIDQLIKHVHALKLDEIAQAAEAKQREYEKNKQPDSIEFTSSTTNVQVAPTPVETPAPNNSADFDALVQSPTTQSFDDLQTEYTAAPAKEEPVAEVQPLDFDFNFEQKQTTEPTPVVTEAPDTQEPAPLEFSFNLESAPTPAVEEAKIEEVKSDLDFNLTDLNVSTEPTPTEVTPSLDFTFEPTPSSTEAIVVEKTEFSFDVAEPTTVEPKIDFNAPTTQSVDTANDPLAQSFPDLKQLDENQLNLDLAEQYIELGAYESARILLQNSASGLNAEQQQRSEKLLNQIAS